MNLLSGAVIANQSELGRSKKMLCTKNGESSDVRNDINNEAKFYFLATVSETPFTKRFQTIRKNLLMSDIESKLNFPNILGN